MKGNCRFSSDLFNEFISLRNSWTSIQCMLFQNRQYSDHKGYSDQVEQELQKHTNQGETHHVLPESKTTDKEKDGR